MFMEMPRKYQLRARADRSAGTRQRIVEAIARLHMEFGPARTTISAIAQAADVERLTVYRHFPDETSMYRACGAHWLGLHPRPDVKSWSSVADPIQRLSVALPELYAFYRETAAMTSKILRDEKVLPELAATANVAGWISGIGELLVEAWPESRAALVRPLVGLAVDFSTWDLLAGTFRLADAEVARIMVQMMTCAETKRS